MSNHQIHVSGGSIINTLFASLFIVAFVVMMAFQLIETRTVSKNKDKIRNFILAESKANTEIDNFYLKKLSNSDNDFWKNSLIIPSASLNGLDVSSVIHVFHPSKIDNDTLDEYVFKGHISTFSNINTNNLIPRNKSISIREVFKSKPSHQRLRQEFHKIESFNKLKNSNFTKDENIKELYENTLKLIEVLGFTDKRGIIGLVSMS